MNRRDEKQLLYAIGIIMCLAAGVVVCAQEASAQNAAGTAQAGQASLTPIGQPQKAETLVGRGNKVEVIRKDGAVEEIPKRNLAILNRASVPARPAPATKAAQKLQSPSAETGDKPEEGGKPAEETGKTDQKSTKSEGEAESGQKKPATGATDKQSASKPPGKRDQSAKEADAEAKRKDEAKQAAKEKAEAIKKSNIEEIRKLEWQGAWFYDNKGKPISQEELDKRIEAGNVSDIQAKDIYLQEWKMEPGKPGEDKQESPSSGTNNQENPAPAMETGER